MYRDAGWITSFDLSWSLCVSVSSYVSANVVSFYMIVVDWYYKYIFGVWAGSIMVVRVFYCPVFNMLSAISFFPVRICFHGTFNAKLWRGISSRFGHWEGFISMLMFQFSLRFYCSLFEYLSLREYVMMVHWKLGWAEHLLVTRGWWCNVGARGSNGLEVGYHAVILK